MILAGIDEAGLGPTLGPLVTASAAIAAPDGWTPSSPWDKANGVFRREWKRNGAGAVVGDSKIVYARGGMMALELTLGAVARAMCPGTPAVPEVIDSEPGAGAHPCYSGGIEPFPVHAGAEEVARLGGAVREGLAAAGASAAHLRAAALYEPALNARFARGMNKNQALLMETGGHLRCLVERFAGNGLSVVIDKQGGRNGYLPFLLGLFPEWWTEELEAGAACSRYRIRHPEGTVEVEFRAKGDRDSFATALASMAAKYVRERAMAELNAWFCSRHAEVKPTAGYPQDAARWLAEMRGRVSGDELSRVVRLR